MFLKITFLHGEIFEFPSFFFRIKILFNIIGKATVCVTHPLLFLHKRSTCRGFSTIKNFLQLLKVITICGGLKVHHYKIYNNIACLKNVGHFKRWNIHSNWHFGFTICLTSFFSHWVSPKKKKKKKKREKKKNLQGYSNTFSGPA